MSETPPLKTMKRYLFRELSETESEALEARFFADPNFFCELAELENDLIDRFARGTLTKEDAKRFARGLADSPDARAKLENARALQILIGEERIAAPLSAPLPASPTFGQRVAGFFNLNPTAPRFAAAAFALAFLVFGTIGFLIYRNRQTQTEYVREKNAGSEGIEGENRRQQSEADQKRAGENRFPNAANENRLENGGGNVQNSGDAPNDVEKRRVEAEKIRRALEDSKRKQNKSPNSNQLTASKEYTAVNILPISADERTGGAPTAELTVRGARQQIKITKLLPAGKSYASFEIIAGGRTVKSAAVAENAGFIEFTLPTDVESFEIKINEQAARGGSETLGTYRLKLVKPD